MPTVAQLVNMAVDFMAPYSPYVGAMAVISLIVWAIHRLFPKTSD